MVTGLNSAGQIWEVEPAKRDSTQSPHSADCHYAGRGAARPGLCVLGNSGRIFFANFLY
jgi:hypothetical protein